MGVGCVCGCPISSRVVRRMAPSLALMNSAANSASAADFVFDGERNYEIDLLEVLAFQLLDFSGFVWWLYWFLRRIYVSVSFGSWKVLEAKRVVICIGLWGLEDLCLDVCSVFGGCFSEVLLRYERLPFASQLGRLGLMRHDARHRSNTVASEFTQTRVTSCGLAFPSGAARQMSEIASLKLLVAQNFLCVSQETSDKQWPIAETTVQGN